MGSVAGGSVIPTGGGAVTILVGSIFVAVACGIVAIEVNRNLWGGCFVTHTGWAVEPVVKSPGYLVRAVIALSAVGVFLGPRATATAEFHSRADPRLR